VSVSITDRPSTTRQPAAGTIGRSPGCCFRCGRAVGRRYPGGRRYRHLGWPTPPARPSPSTRFSPSVWPRRLDCSTPQRRPSIPRPPHRGEEAARRAGGRQQRPRRSHGRSGTDQLRRHDRGGDIDRPPNLGDRPGSARRVGATKGAADPPDEGSHRPVGLAKHRTSPARLGVLAGRNLPPRPVAETAHPSRRSAVSGVERRAVDTASGTIVLSGLAVAAGFLFRAGIGSGGPAPGCHG
jgi:hypothetical protein